MIKYIVFDITNLLYRTFYAHTTENDITIAGLASHGALVTLNKYFRETKPHKVIMCFDRSSWRKDYTKSDQCVSKKIYKGNRRQNMSPSQKEKFNNFCKHLDEFETMMRDHTSVITLSADKLEADDLIAGVVQVLTLEPNNHITIISSDSDFIQLLGYSNVRIINPTDGKERNLAEWNNDAEYFLFEKCFRGDITDNVQSALPKVRTTKIKKAYTDSFELANLMNTVWKDPHGNEFVVKHIFNENKLLVDLRAQPDQIQKKIITTVLEGLKNPGSFSYFHFLKFLGKYELKKIAQQAESFVPLLSR